MKGTSKLTKKDQPKSDLTSNKEGESSTNGGGSTPEIALRSRQSLGEYAGNREDGNEQGMERMNEQFLQQERELLELKEALRESHIERQATSNAYREMSEKLSNSIPLTPGPNINKPRVPRPQDTQRIKLSCNLKKRVNKDKKLTPLTMVEKKCSSYSHT